MDSITQLQQITTKIEGELDQMQNALTAALGYITRLEHENGKLRRYREGL